MSELIIFKDIWFAVIAEPEEYCVNYKIYEIGEFLEDGKDTPKFNRAGAQTGPDHVENIADAEVFAHGFVKWDGCSNWEFDIQNKVMIHACERNQLVNLGEVLARCWDMTEKLCEHWLG